MQPYPKVPVGYSLAAAIFFPISKYQPCTFETSSETIATALSRTRSRRPLQFNPTKLPLKQAKG